jgi:hypothetical protein
MISPPQTAGMLLILLLVAPAACILVRHGGSDRVSTENIRNAFADIESSAFIAPVKKLEFLQGTAMVSPPRSFDLTVPPPEETEPDPEPELRMMEPEKKTLEAALAIVDVCKESGGWKITRYKGWYCSYPHRHRHVHHHYYHRRRHRR